MKHPRKIIVHIATSADGYIARPNGDVAWLNRPRPKDNYGYAAFFKSIDTILWGYKTYAQGLEMGMEKSMKSGFGTQTKNYVFSRHSREAPLPTFEFVNQPIKSFAQHLRAQPGKKIWMMGGGEIIASFLDAGEIDEFRIHVIPILIGEGIPLIQPRHRFIRLKLLSSKSFLDGVVRLHYRTNPHP
ncbi:MAG TPA: dihydrofolate reductase family protein [Candidatus Cybelea sp.]|nr:dihydrofolate reductase family protein [Candidatus Cybelea sp.]